jgi:uncharacterized protein (TIGR00661 family)
MRIAYGVFGYGRGHATRAGAVLQHLVHHHDVLILAGGDACDALRPHYDVTVIPTLGYHYNAQGRLSPALTLRRNAANVADLLSYGFGVKQVARQLRDFSADVVISDAEPFTHRAARLLNIPRIGFDHFGIMVYCRPEMPLRDRILSRRDTALYRWLMGKPERVIVSSFYPAPARDADVHVIGPLLRREVFNVTSENGDHLLAYFNKGQHQFLPHVRAALQSAGAPVYVYGTGQSGSDGALQFFPYDDHAFLQHLASCRALISTAGNQLVGEAVHFGKPMLVMPEDCVEQRLNADQLEALGLGMQVPLAQFSGAAIEEFLNREKTFRSVLQNHRRDGRQQAIALIERFVTELTQARSGIAARQSA